jgi:hypothetical protein
MKEEIYKCDGCGKQKGSVNHWYAVCVDKSGMVLTTLDNSAHLRPIVEVAAEVPKYYWRSHWEHFCGEECLLKMVARNLPK